MKKISVIVKEKTILELAEAADKGDIIDLKELVELDTSFIENIIELGKDKVYQSKLDELRNTLKAESALEQQKLNASIEALKKENISNLKIKEQEVENKYKDVVNELSNKVEVLNKEKETLLKEKEQELISKYDKQIIELKSELELVKETKKLDIDSIEKKGQIALSSLKEQETKKYQEIKVKFDLLEASLEAKLKQKELEIENKYINEINTLKNEKEIIKNKMDLEREKALNEQKEVYAKELLNRDELINNLQRQKSSMNVKQTGEDLESWCDNEVTSYMQNGLFNCIWHKDNKVVKNEDETKGSKADYIFKVYASDKHIDNELLASVCLDMKDENPDSKTKQTNAHYYKALNDNRNKKNCKYALLVSNLERDKPNDLPIYKVREYENMYVVRPAYMMPFLNMLASLTSRFSELVLSKEKEIVELRSKLDLADEFEKIKETYLDKPLESLDKQIDAIIKSSESIKKASNEIDATCEKIKSSYINNILDKISKFEIKLNKLTKKLD